jgi:hypothetical protein
MRRSRWLKRAVAQNQRKKRQCNLNATEFDQYVRDVWAWTQSDGVTLGEYAVGAPVYRTPKRNWDDQEEALF